MSMITSLFRNIVMQMLRTNTFFGWRKSWCIAEIDQFVKDASAKHTKCIQIIKYFAGKVNYLKFDPFFENYHVKNVALNHSKTCSNTTNDCVECVMQIFEEFISTYGSTQLKQFHESNINLLNKYTSDECNRKKARIQKIIETLCSLSDTDSCEILIERIKKLKHLAL